jgi:hypothetical protein
MGVNALRQLFVRLQCFAGWPMRGTQRVRSLPTKDLALVAPFDLERPAILCSIAEL